MTIETQTIENLYGQHFEVVIDYISRQISSNSSLLRSDFVCMGAVNRPLFLLIAAIGVKMTCSRDLDSYKVLQYARNMSQFYPHSKFLAHVCFLSHTFRNDVKSTCCWDETKSDPLNQLIGKPAGQTRQLQALLPRFS